MEQERAREQEETERRRRQEEERQAEEIEQDVEEENQYLTESAEDAMKAEAELHHRETVQEQEENAVLNQALDEYEARQVA